jgi:hypothetical protein
MPELDRLLQDGEGHITVLTNEILAAQGELLCNPFSRYAQLTHIS